MEKNTGSQLSAFQGRSPVMGPVIQFTGGQFSRSLHEQHRGMEQRRVLAFLRHRLIRQWGFAEVVGQWVWVHASDTLTELEQSMLFELGFHWSPRRRAWQHPCGVFSAPGRGQFGRYFPAEQEPGPLEFRSRC